MVRLGPFLLSFFNRYIPDDEPGYNENAKNVNGRMIIEQSVAMFEKIYNDDSHRTYSWRYFCKKLIAD